MIRRLARRLWSFAGLALFAAALWVLHQQLRIYHPREILAGLRQVPPWRILASLVLTAANYLVLTGYERLAFRYIRHPLPYRRIGVASFVGYALSNNVGFPMLSGSSIRCRLYSSWGVSGGEIARVIAFITLTFWLGLFALVGVLLLACPVDVPAGLHLPMATTRPIGVITLLILAAYVAWSLRRRPIALWGWELSVPPVRYALTQMLVSAIDLALAGSALYVLLPMLPLSYPAFLSVYLLAMVAGMCSQIPGGLGIFETGVLSLLSPILPGSVAIGALLIYRAVYYLLPLAVATLLLGTHEVLARRPVVRRNASRTAAPVFASGPRAPEPVAVERPVDEAQR